MWFGLWARMVTSCRGVISDLELEGVIQASLEVLGQPEAERELRW